ncbi:MAG: FliI/YscN family ATPase [Firmicutes bacterium]|nr:FliI/YscN family ATPase [Bacillota bacterium]
MAGISLELDHSKYLATLASFQGGRVTGKVRQVVGLVMEVTGIRPFIGEICRVKTMDGRLLNAEVVGFRDRCTLLMPLEELKGISPGCPVLPTGKSFRLRVGPGLKGRVLDGLGRLLDSGLPPLPPGEGMEYPVDNSPPNPLERRPITQPLYTGVKAIDALLTCGEGQRVGIFSGSGVGKSTLLGMIARYSEADVNVIALIGERGREVGDFLYRQLGEDGLRRSVVVVATSDRPALERVMGSLVAMTIAEYFRDQGQRVVLMMDSVTRLCMAQREIGLAVGEPPTAKGYTPSVFAMLARYLERSGMGPRGSITGFYNVLVDGDDFTEPVADAARSTLDGHIVLSRKLASQNRYPAVDVLRSVSRLMPQVTSKEHRAAAGELRRLLSTYEEMEDLINIGAYTFGTREEVDRAVRKRPEIIKFLNQEPDQHYAGSETLAMLQRLAAAPEEV